MKDILMIQPKLVDVDWKLSLISEAKNKIEQSMFKISVKLVLDHGDGQPYEEKYLEFTPVQFFEFFKNINDCKNLLDMAN